MRIQSPEFQNGEAIPQTYTCDGADQSPPLEFFDIPAGSKTLALLMEDSDALAGNFVHWILFNLPAETRQLDKNHSGAGFLSQDFKHGMNDFRKIGYGGPRPPAGTHHYHFKLFALDRVLDLDEGATRSQLKDAMDGHVLAEAELVATYQRTSRKNLPKKAPAEPKVDEALKESFPASDPPAWTTGTEAA